MGCSYSKSTIEGPLYPSKEWKMDFRKYDKPLNENDLDDLRRVKLLKTINYYSNSGMIVLIITWIYGRS